MHPAFIPRDVRLPRATYGFLNESQARIAHHCLEPELPGEGGKEGRGKGGDNERGELDLALCMVPLTVRQK